MRIDRLIEVKQRKIAIGYERLLERFLAWAAKEDPIRAAAVIGSRARIERPADAFADLDLLLFATEPEHYLRSDDWVRSIGDFLISFVEPTAEGGEKERRVLFEDGLDVDFALMPLAWLAGPGDPSRRALIGAVAARGLRVVLDKDGLAASLALVPATPTSVPLPGQDEFLNVVNDFWYHAVWTAKHVRRGELWWAKSGADGRLKSLLLRMLEWQAHAVRGAGADTWFRGRFLEQWADPRAVMELAQAFAHYDVTDIWRALFVTMDLFGWLGRATGERLKFEYPAAAEREATRLVEELYELRVATNK